MFQQFRRSLTALAVTAILAAPASADLNAAKSPGMRSQLWAIKWKAEAWTGAVESCMSSSYSQIGSVISTVIKPRALAQPNSLPVAENAATAAIPVCDGKVIKPEILSAVPLDTFGDRVLDAVKDWRYKASKTAASGSCRLNSRNHVFHVQFVIGR
jgi:hypothetical protein